jgi:hypothetical protein
VVDLLNVLVANSPSPHALVEPNALPFPLSTRPELYVNVLLSQLLDKYSDNFDMSSSQSHVTRPVMLLHVSLQPAILAG